jgi:hypothetical protein
VTSQESLELLLERWTAVESVVREYGGDPHTDLSRDGLVVRLRILSAERPEAGSRVRDLYLFKLDFADYDDHAPRLALCDPRDPAVVGVGKQFYPKIDGNNVFVHDTFFCMPGDRRCYEQSNHSEWRKKEHYHPEIVIGYLFELLRSPTYRGRLQP